MAMMLKVQSLSASLEALRQAPWPERLAASTSRPT
jgi:hypothetical protein